MVLREGDKIQLHVSILGGVKRFIYLYWYDTEGVGHRLWPLDADMTISNRSLN